MSTRDARPEQAASDWRVNWQPAKRVYARELGAIERWWWIDLLNEEAFWGARTSKSAPSARIPAVALSAGVARQDLPCGITHVRLAAAASIKDRLRVFRHSAAIMLASSDIVCSRDNCAAV